MAFNNAVNANSTGIQTLSSAGAWTGSTVTQYGVLVGGATNAVGSTAVGSAGQVLQSSGAGVNPAYSTATFPSTATSTGTILRADGTNWVATTNTFPNTATAGALLVATASNVIGEITDVATGQVLASGGVGTVPAYTATPSVTSMTLTSTGVNTLIAGSDSIASGFQTSAVSLVGKDTFFNLAINRTTANANPPQINFQKSRGTFASPAIVSASDFLGQVAFWGYDGSTTIQAARIDGIVDGTPGASDMPGALIFNTTPDGSTAPAEAMRLSNDKKATFAGTVVMLSSTIASLPAASSNTYGRRFVTDALAPVFAAIVAAGGAVVTPVYSDGTNWRCG